MTKSRPSFPRFGRRGLKGWHDSVCFIADYRSSARLEATHRRQRCEDMAEQGNDYGDKRLLDSWRLALLLSSLLRWRRRWQLRAFTGLSRFRCEMSNELVSELKPVAVEGVVQKDFMVGKGA